MSAPFELDAGPFHAPELRVLGFRSRASISGEYVVTITVAASGIDATVIEETLVGQAMSLWIDQGGSGRPTHGICASAGWNGAAERGRDTFRLRLVPRFAMLKRQKRSRIFQEQSVPAIVDAILGQWRLERRSALVRQYPKRTYCVQYRETDHAFVRRLLAEEGIFTFFEHETGDTERLVLADAQNAYPPVPGEPALHYRPAQGAHGLAAEEHDVLAFTARRAARTTSVFVREYDFERPLADLSSSASIPSPEDAVLERASASAGGAAGANTAGSGAASGAARGGSALEYYEHHADYEKIDVERDEARVRLEQLRARAYVARGTTHCRRLLPGHRLRLVDHEVVAHNRGWVVTRVEARAHAPEVAPAGSPAYEAHFECAPEEIPVRPPPPRREAQQVVETATVVGPPGEEIYTDPLGRIKVQFHWDRDGRRNDHSSCWIRHAEAWAGRGWGTQFIPRVGMEVLVTFLGGDVDRPLVTGAVSNAAHPPPFTLPERKTKSGVRTESTPGGGGHNELSFEDKRGQELVYLRAERDLALEVRGAKTEVIGGGRTSSITGPESLAVTDRSLTIEGTDLVSVRGTRTVTIKKDHNHAVLGNNRTLVSGTHAAVLDGGSQTSVRGTCSARVEGDCSIELGHPGRESAAQIHTTGMMSVNATEVLSLSADKGIRLICGESRIELTPDRIQIVSANVDISGSKAVSARGDGPSLSLAEEAEIVSKVVKIFAEEATIELDKDAKIWGKTIKLNCSKDDPKVAEQSAETKTKPFKVVLQDENFEPYAGHKFALSAAGKRLEGTTDGDGTIDVEVPEEAQLAEITLWLGEYPTGETKRWTVRIAALPPVKEPAGALQRLKNLGYHAGPVKDEPDPEALRTAVRWFQEDHDLDPTGELDAKTAGELEKVHGY
jgi:type VI secretion system secreted protein VgrG